MPPAELNSNIYNEILSWVSLETLGRCRLVNKEWNRISYEMSAKSLHSSRTGTLRGHLISSYQSKNRTVMFAPTNCSPLKNHEGDTVSLEFVRPVSGGSITVEACHMGIILCWRDGPKNHHHVPQFLICIPSTGQWAVIPNPRTRSETKLFNLAVLRSKPTLRFKILRVSRNKHTCANYVHSSFWCEVFDSDLWRWRRLDDIRLPVAYYSFCLGDGITVSGTTYAHTKFTDGLFAFDMLNDTWEILPLPFGELEEFEEVELTKIEGRLGVVWRGRDQIVRRVWVMEDRCNKVWRERNHDDLNPEDEPWAVKEFHFSRTMQWPEKILRYCLDLEPADYGLAHVPK